MFLKKSALLEAKSAARQEPHHEAATEPRGMRSHPNPKTTSHWLEAWHVDPSANREYDFIDGLRGLAILMVIAGHYVYFGRPSGLGVHFVANVFGTLWVGVILFFTLSGFLISWPFWKRKAARNATLVPPGYSWLRF